MSEKNEILVGAHMSAAGGAYNALHRGYEIGATVIQLFTSNQKQWNGKKITEKEVELWKEGIIETGITHTMSHDSYLINLGSPKEELLAKSKKAFLEEMSRCHLLEIDYMNFHPGAATGSSEEECLDTIISSLLEMTPNINEGKTELLLETTAGQGTTVGYSFDHLGYIIKKVGGKIPLGVCIDTCHIFSAGYDIRTKEAWDQTLKEFDEKIGLKYLKAFHLNDSLHDLGSRKDRHASLGKGKIGLECFTYLMQNEKTKDLPKYLETPDGDKYWKDEIKLLKDTAKDYAHQN
jgi:deoxyribonuclease-4